MDGVVKHSITMATGLSATPSSCVGSFMLPLKGQTGHRLSMSLC